MMEILKGKQREDDLVTVARFTNQTAAHSLRILLEAHDIKVSVLNEESTSMLGTSIFGQLSPVGIEVCVFRRDEKDAKLIMDKVPLASESLIPEWCCECGETVDAGFHTCWSCGKQNAAASE